MEPPRLHPVPDSREKGGRSSVADSEEHGNGAVTPEVVQAPCIQDYEDGRAARTVIHATAISHLHGPRPWMVTSLNATMLFLVQTEIFIVTTSLVAIAEELGNFDMASWVLASYFLGYVSTLLASPGHREIFPRWIGIPSFLMSNYDQVSL